MINYWELSLGSEQWGLILPLLGLGGKPGFAHSTGPPSALYYIYNIKHMEVLWPTVSCGLLFPGWVGEGNQMIRPQAIRLLQIRPIQIRLHAHSSIYKFVPMSNFRPIQGIVSLHNMRRQFIINKSQVHQHIEPCKDLFLGF